MWQVEIGGACFVREFDIYRRLRLRTAEITSRHISESIALKIQSARSDRLESERRTKVVDPCRIEISCDAPGGGVDSSGDLRSAPEHLESCWNLERF